MTEILILEELEVLWLWGFNAKGQQSFETEDGKLKRILMFCVLEKNTLNHQSAYKEGRSIEPATQLIRLNKH